MNDIVARKESFGGVVGRRNGYGFHVVNKKGFGLIAASRELPPEAFGRLCRSEAGHAEFMGRLGAHGFLGEGGRFAGEVVDNRNDVPYLSAPIRVWLEVTSRCNLDCGECFNKNHGEFYTDLPFESVLRIVDDLKAAGVLQLTITGGEPLLRKDIFRILDHVFERGFGVRFFTNGTTLNEQNAERLAGYDISHIFASLDGVGETNDVLRGEGTFGRISRGIVGLARRTGNVTLSVTLHAFSLPNVRRVFLFARENNVRSLLIRPLLQYSDKATPLAIGRDRLGEYLEALEAASAETGVEYQLNKLPFFPLHKSVYLHDRPSDVHFSHFSPHNQFGCVGGNTVVGVKSNGVVMACGFVPIKYVVPGNSVLEKPFLQLWNESENITVLRDLAPNDECKSCRLLSVCGGGCRANALLRNGSLNAIDPYCFWKGGGPPPDLRRPAGAEAPFNSADAPTPFISERTIVTKCGSGTML